MTVSAKTLVLLRKHSILNVYERGNVYLDQKKYGGGFRLLCHPVYIYLWGRWRNCRMIFSKSRRMKYIPSFKYIVLRQAFETSPVLYRISLLTFVIFLINGNIFLLFNKLCIYSSQKR